MKNAIIAFALCASPALADGYSDDANVRLFTDHPCTEVLTQIDWITKVDGDAYLMEHGLKGLTQRAAQSAVAWGVLLGVDLERGGLHGNSKTTLQRLRDACAVDPDQTAKAILDSL